MMHLGMWYGGDWGWVGWIGMVVWWLLILLLVVSAIKWFSSTQGGSEGGAHGKSGLEILKERYAKGEIEKKEFEEKRKVLES